MEKTIINLRTSDNQYIIKSSIKVLCSMKSYTNTIVVNSMVGNKKKSSNNDFEFFVR